MLAVALLGTFNFGHIVEGAVANSEALYGLLTAIAMFGVWRWLRDGARRPAAWAALAGAAGGYAMVVRAEFLACAVLFAALAWWMHRARRAASPVDPALVVFLAVFGAVLVPTTVWHWRTLTTFNERHVERGRGAAAALRARHVRMGRSISRWRTTRTPTADPTAIIRCSTSAIRRPRRA